MSQPAVQQPGTLSIVKPALPQFEGSQLEGVVIKIQGTLPPGQDIDGTGDKVLCIDDRCRLVGDYRVVEVKFKVAANGDMIREHILKPLELALTPYDPANPQDDGVWRARPGSVPQP